MTKKSDAYIVRTATNKIGFVYWDSKFVNKKAPVYFIDDKGVEDKKPVYFDSIHLTILISLFNGRSKRMRKLPYIN